MWWRTWQRNWRWQRATEKGLFRGGPMTEIRPAADLLYGLPIPAHPWAEPRCICKPALSELQRASEGMASTTQAGGLWAVGRPIARRGAHRSAASVQSSVLGAPRTGQGDTLSRRARWGLCHTARVSSLAAPANQAATSTSVPRSVQPCSRTWIPPHTTALPISPSSPGRIVHLHHASPKSPFPRPPASATFQPAAVALLALLLLSAASPTHATGTLRSAACAARYHSQLSLSSRIRALDPNADTYPSPCSGPSRLPRLPSGNPNHHYQSPTRLDSLRTALRTTRKDRHGRWAES